MFWFFALSQCLGESASGRRIAGLQGEAPGRWWSPEQRRCGTRDTGRKGEVGPCWAEWGQDRAWLELLLPDRRTLGRGAGRCVVDIVRTLIPHLLPAVWQHRCGTRARKACRYGDATPGPPEPADFQHKCPTKRGSRSCGREGAEPDTLRPQDRVRWEMLPVNCFCLMNCSFSLQQQIRAIKH